MDFNEVILHHCRTMQCRPLVRALISGIDQPISKNNELVCISRMSKLMDCIN